MIHISFDSNNKKLPLLEFLFILFSVVFYIQFDIQKEYFDKFLIASFAYVAFVANKNPETRKSIFVILSLILLIVTLTLFLNDSESIGNVSNKGLKRFYAKFTNYYYMYFPLIPLYRTVIIASKTQISFIIGLACAISLWVAQMALAIVNIDPMLMHTFNTNMLEGNGVSFVGYYFIYSFTFVAVVATVIYKYCTLKSIRLISLFLITYTMYLLFKCQYSLSVVTTAISCYYVYYIGSNNKGRKITIFIVAIILGMLLPHILEFIVSISSSELLNERFKEINMFLAGDDSLSSESDLIGRLELYGKAISAFFHSPIWGNRSLSFDGHATLLMIWANLGLLGGVPFFYLLFKSRNLVYSILGYRKVYFKPIFLQILLMGFTNPILGSPSNFIMLWFLCPLAISLFVKR